MSPSSNNKITQFRAILNKTIEQKLLSIFTLEFWLLGIPFIFTTLILCSFIAGYLAKYLKNDHPFTTFILSFFVGFFLITRICKNKQNDQEKSLTNFLKTRSKKFTFILLFIIWQFFNFTGFCYQEMRYLTDKELVDRVVMKRFVMENEEERKAALNHKCTIKEDNITDSELNEKFATRKCRNADYSSWKEFFAKRLDRECSEDLINYSTKDCGTFYYSSLEKFYEENPNCCGILNLTADERYSNGDPSQLEVIFGKLFGFNSSKVEVNILKIDESFNRAGWTENKPEFPYLYVYFETDCCGNPGYTRGWGLTEEGHKHYLEKRLSNNKNSKN